MIQVFAKVSYGVFEIEGFFNQFYKFIGHFQIEQTITEAYDKCFRLWFFTDQIEIKDGELREVEIVCHNKNGGHLTFEIHKLIP